MSIDNRLVQVVMLIPENSLALGVVGMTCLMWPAAGVGIPDMYGLEPEFPDDRENVKGLLFTERELKVLPEYSSSVA